ncbi:MAG: carbohydrate ABC transporter permease, partial [Clostridia bacterium]|nr:carbohydrate ABC transporter permease [Clostridia bacterium]
VILGLTNTYAGLIIPSVAAPTTVFFLKQYLETTYSKEIIEAARIDGSQEFMTFNRIVIPLSIPAMATMAIFSFVYSWNNYMGPLMIIDDTNKYTFPLLVQILKANPKFQDLALIYTSLLLITLPLLIVYLAFSKYIVGGVAIGGVKE